MGRIKDELIAEAEFALTEPIFGEPCDGNIHTDSDYICPKCGGDGVIELMGGSDYDEWTVVGYLKCECQED